MPVVVLCASELRPGTDPFVQLKGTLEALDGGVVATIGMSGCAIAELVRGNTNALRPAAVVRGIRKSRLFWPRPGWNS